MTIAVDLRAEGRQGARDIQGLPELCASDRDAAIATWRGRMVNEHISCRVFAALIPQMMRAGIEPSWQAAAADAIADELRHARECAAVVHALGGDPYAELEHLADVPAHADAGPLEAVLRNVLSISCLSETVAVALIGAERLRAGPAAIERTLGKILADEVRHASMGWRLLQAKLGTLDGAALERMNRYLVVALRHLVAHELAHLPRGASPSLRAGDVGVCDGDEARELFFATVQQVIVPRLQGMGLNAESAWAEVQADA